MSVVQSTRLGDVTPTYQRGVVPCDLSSCFHEEIYESLREGILKINHNMNGFSYGDALLTAVETRSSAPIRILRDETLQSVYFKRIISLAVKEQDMQVESFLPQLTASNVRNKFCILPYNNKW